MRSQKGERNPTHRLTEDEIMEIRRIWARNVTAKELAAKYGVAPITIYKVVSDQCWTHLPGVAEIRRGEE